MFSIPCLKDKSMIQFHWRGPALILVAVLTASLSACGGGKAPAPTVDISSAAATIVASTFQAATQAASLNTPTPLPLTVGTPTGSTPMLYINNNVKCRNGIGANFKVVAALTPGISVELVGKNSAANAWLVKDPGSGQLCWVLVQDGTPTGDYFNLPEATPQVTIQGPPDPLSISNYNFTCAYPPGGGESVDADFSWIYPSDSANGFRIYRDGTQIADLTADATSYHDTALIVPGGSVTYGFQAYNDIGVSGIKHILIKCSK